MRVKICPEDIRIGEPLNWDLYNAAGNRVFRKGFMVNSEQSRRRLLELKLYFEPTHRDRPGTKSLQPPDTSAAKISSPTRTPVAANNQHAPRRREVCYAFDIPPAEIEELVAGNIFSFLDYCIAQEKWICDGMLKGQSDLLRHIDKLADYLENLFIQAPDACLGAIHLDFENLYSSCHPVYSAILSLLIAKGLNIDGTRHRSVIRAALTANLGMYEYHDRLVNMNAKLSDDEFAVLKTHPELSIRMLLSNGVTDQLWLEIIMQHHERGDGSGYPKGLTRKQIHAEAAILATVDTYLAFIMPRAYRKSVPPKIAMQKIYKTAVTEDDALSLGLIKQLGVYPPGSLVRLANQEIAVVTERNANNSLAPKVACIGMLNGSLYSEPIHRATVSETYRIIENHISEETVEIDMNKLWNKELTLNFLVKE